MLKALYEKKWKNFSESLTNEKSTCASKYNLSQNLGTPHLYVEYIL